MPSKPPPPRPAPARGPSLGAAAERLRARSGLIVAFGVVTALLGVAALILTDVAGLFAIALPAPASVVITLMLGAGLLATGVLRVVLGLKMEGSRARSGIIASGLITALLGLLIVLSWPSSSVLVLGTFLGIDLLLYGITWAVFGYRLGMHRR